MAKPTNDTATIGFVGAGVMGANMAAHLLEAGYPLNLYTRTESKAQALIDKGAVWRDSPAELAKAVDVVITIVGFPADVEQLYLGEKGLIAAATEGTYLIDMTTSSPDLAKTIYGKARDKGVAALDAPVSGGDIGAREARLSIMAGGDRDAYEAMLPLLEIMGKNIVYQGPAGSGQHCKMANQIAIATNIIGVCEAIAYAQRAGLDPRTVLKSIANGAAGSWSLSNLGPRMIAGNFDPGFYVKHFIKDMNIAYDSARKLALNTPGLALSRDLYRQLAENGHENDGTQALFRLFEQ